MSTTRAGLEFPTGRPEDLMESVRRLAEFDRGQEVVRVTAAYTVALDDDLVLVTTGGSAIAITLPRADEAQRKLYHIKKIDAGAGTVVVTRTAADLINGATTLTLFSVNEAVALLPEADNDAWWSV